MDPFSIVASTAGISDVTFRLVRFLKGTIQGARDVDEDLRNLLIEVESLISINNGLNSITAARDFEHLLRRSFEESGSLTESWKQLWHNASRIANNITRLLEKLEAILKAVQGADCNVKGIRADEVDEQRSQCQPEKPKNGTIRTIRNTASAKIESIRTQVRKQSKSAELQDVRQQLGSSQNAFGTCLTMINLGWNVRSHNIHSEQLNASREEFHTFMTVLQGQMLASERVASGENCANQVFQAPAASDLFTGRTALLIHVREAFNLGNYRSGRNVEKYSKVDKSTPPDSSTSGADDRMNPTRPQNGARPSYQPPPDLGRAQKRFILIGLGGSGKTEFCRKFAEQNQASFWGVFWIDATSDETAQHSYKEVARLGGVEENTKSAMTWLAGTVQPWLLVIDNADDPNMEVDKYFPGGERGCVLVTTRIPVLKRFGNAGQGFCDLERLEPIDARDLLLKHAQEETPWGSSALSLGQDIAEVLGYLPLALVYAGKVIAEGITTLEEFIPWFDDSWDRVRLASARSGRIVDESSKNVFAPYDAMLQNLSHDSKQSAQDAIELLKMFSFLHHENISLEILTTAARNPPAVESRLKIEFDEKQQRATPAHCVEITHKPKTWRRTIIDGAIQLLMWYEDRVLYPILPSALRSDKAAPFDIHRLRAALARLTQKSLVAIRRKNGIEVYSMHPLIHKWVRERPQMSIGERALWCQASVTVLNQCIPLPPLGGNESDVAFRRQLLPHLDATRKCQKDIRHHLGKNQESRALPTILLLQSPDVDRTRAQQYARFSRLYVECGRFHDAKDLQEQVKNYAIDMLGPDDERTTHIMLALSGTLWWLSRFNDAATLQKQALITCTNALGPEHPRTLKIMDALGKSECFRGRFKEARKLHEDSIAGMRRVLPKDHPDIFIAIEHLGDVWFRYFQCDKAEECHSQAYEGLAKALGKEHPDTLLSKENLAMTYLEKVLNFGYDNGLGQAIERGADQLQKAYTLEYQVLETRRKTLGKENNWTLWAICNLARIKASLGHLEEAEADMQVALQAGIRNIGEEHFAVLAGKTQLARVIAAQKRYDEAEAMFQDVVVKGSYNQGQRAEGENPDHLVAVWYYAGCCQLNGKVAKAIGLLQGMTGGLTAIGATKHPFWDRVLRRLDVLKKEEADEGMVNKDLGQAGPVDEPSFRVGYRDEAEVMLL